MSQPRFVPLSVSYLISERVVRPGVVHLLEHVATARERAGRKTWTLLAHLAADPGRRAELDGLLVVDTALGSTPLAWLNVGPSTSSPAAVKAQESRSFGQVQGGALPLVTGLPSQAHESVNAYPWCTRSNAVTSTNPTLCTSSQLQENWTVTGGRAAPGRT